MNVRRVSLKKETGTICRAAARRVLRTNGACLLFQALAGLPAAAVGLGLLLFAAIAAPAAELVPAKGSLAFPATVTAGGKPVVVECNVPYGPPAPVAAVAFSPDGKTLASAGYGEVLLWDLEGATLVKRLGAGQITGRVGALAFVRDGLLAVGEGTPYSTGAVRLYDVAAGKQTRALEEPGEVVYAIAVSPDGKLLAAGGAEPVVRVWNVDEKKLVATLEDHSAWVQGLDFSRDGNLLASAGADHNVLVWDVADWGKLPVKLREKEPVRGVAFSSDANVLLSASGGPTSRVLNQRRRDNVRYQRAFYINNTTPLDVAWNAKVNQYFVACDDGTVRALDANGRTKATMTGHDGWVYAVAASTDGAKVASAGADGTVKLWNAADGKLLAMLVQLAPKSDQWLVMTPPGYLATSVAAALNWNPQGTAASPEKLTELLSNPESVKQALAGSQVAPPILE